MQPSQLRATLKKSYLINFLINAQFFGSITVPFFLEWGKLTYTQLFLLEAFFTFCVFLFEIPTGYVADKWGRKISLFLGGICSGISLFIFGVTDVYLAFFAAEFIGALGLALLSGADRSLIYDALLETGKEGDAGHIMSRHEQVGTLGVLMGLPVGSFLAGSNILPFPQNLTLPFLISSAFFFIASGIAITIKEPKRTGYVEDVITEGIGGLRYIFGHTLLRKLALHFSFISATTFFIFWLYQPLLQSGGVPIQWFGVVGFGFNLFSLFLLSNLKKIEQRIGITSLLFYSTLIPGIAYIGLFLFRNVSFIIFAVFLIVGMRKLRMPLFADYMNRHIESRNRATVLSGISMIERVMIAMMYPVIGILSDMSLSFALIFLGGITFCFALMSQIEMRR